MAAVDIGANLGWFTVHLANLVGLTGRVDAFEPRADLALLLTRSTAENRLSNVVIHGYALGAEEGDGQMIWLREDSNPGGTNLVAATITDPAVMAQPVQVRTLDSCIEHRVDFIKIDVEGAEPLVLSGAQRILAKDRPILLVEINVPNLSRTSNISAAEFGSYVEGLGYRLHELLPDGSRGRPLMGCDLAAVDMLVNVAMVPQERA